MKVGDTVVLKANTLSNASDKDMTFKLVEEMICYRSNGKIVRRKRHILELVKQDKLKAL